VKQLRTPFERAGFFVYSAATNKVKAKIVAILYKKGVEK